ncbi:unnamed protein product [Ectocarpus sp. 6 AP-2014]
MFSLLSLLPGALQSCKSLVWNSSAMPSFSETYQRTETRGTQSARGTRDTHHTRRPRLIFLANTQHGIQYIHHRGSLPSLQHTPILPLSLPYTHETLLCDHRLHESWGHRSFRLAWRRSPLVRIRISKPPKLQSSWRWILRGGSGLAYH